MAEQDGSAYLLWTTMCLSWGILPASHSRKAAWYPTITG